MNMALISSHAFHMVARMCCVHMSIDRTIDHDRNSHPQAVTMYDDCSDDTNFVHLLFSN